VTLGGQVASAIPQIGFWSPPLSGNASAICAEEAALPPQGPVRFAQEPSPSISRCGDAGP